MTDGVNSTWYSIPSRVPKGPITRAPFFLIFISDQREVVTAGNAVSLYADDCKTSRVINCQADHSLFQTNIEEDIIEEEYCKKRSPLLSNLHRNISTLQLTFGLCDIGLITNCNLAGTIILIR